MKAVYLECSSSFWVKIASILRDKLNVEPAYWVAWHHIEDQIKEEFPNCIFHDTANAKKNRIPFEQKARLYSAFTDDCQAIWETESQLVYDMFNRFDHSLDFSFLERQRVFFEMLVYWNSILDEIKPDAVIFPCPPHVVYDYIILCLCRKKNIKTIMFDEVPVLPPYCFAFNDYIEGDLKFLELYQNNLQSNADVKLSDYLSDYINKVKSTYDKAKPPREVIAHKTLRKRTAAEKRQELFKLIIFFIYGILGKSITGINTAALIKEKNAPLIESFTGRFRDFLYQKQLIAQRNLTENRSDHYNSLAISPELDKQYIYISLAGQPERTSNPQGGVFTFQLLMINMLANALPSNYLIYVKEHPNQFHPNMYVNMYRDENFYTSIVRNPRVKLIKMDSNPFKLIDNSAFVATIAGTTGIEALIRGKPVICFGYSWYRFCKGVYHVTTFSELQTAVINVLKSKSINEIETKLFVHSIEEYSNKFLGDPLPSDYGLTEEENINNLIQAITKRLF